MPTRSTCAMSNCFRRRPREKEGQTAQARLEREPVGTAPPGQERAARRCPPASRAHRPQGGPVEAGLSDTDIDSEEAFELGIGARVVPLTTQYGEAFDSTPPAPQERKTGDVEAQIRALEARLDGLIRQRH